MAFNGFQWVAPQIVGSASDWGYSYRCSDDRYPTAKKAFAAGIDELDHDDFVVAEWKNDKIVAVYTDPDKKRADLLKEYGKGVMREYGLAA